MILQQIPNSLCCDLMQAFSHITLVFFFNHVWSCLSWLIQVHPKNFQQIQSISRAVSLLNLTTLHPAPCTLHPKP